MACSPINNLTVQDLKTKGPNPVQGWTFLPTDLNTGVGGDFIYVGYQTGDKNPITSINFQAYSDSQQDNPNPDWEWNSTDLNRNADGKFIYMFWKANEQEKVPIYNLMFIVTDQSSPSAIPGYIAIDQDLNQGAGGPFIFAYYSRSVCPNTEIKVKIKNNKS